MMKDLEAEKKHEELEEKIKMQKANMDFFVDENKKKNLIKQEMRRLKEQDLAELQTH